MELLLYLCRVKQLEIHITTTPCNHSTYYTYDMLGRMVQRVHPDAGTDTYLYDGAGNVTTHSTQVLANANKTINYYYTYNRLDSIVYPINPQNNVRYTYGDSTASYNRRGRIALLEDASGFRAYKYGKLGEVTEEHRTFVLPNESYRYSFKTNFVYDSWNRVQTITYPDGEVVHYRYNTGGMLDTVYGKKVVSGISPKEGIRGGSMNPINPDPIPTPTYTYYYINHTTYNEFELKSGQWYGNGTYSQYTYDTLQRLKTLNLNDGTIYHIALQDITYNYDKVGNIASIHNGAAMYSSMGATYTYTYKYDSLYRIDTAVGSATAGNKSAYYSLAMDYRADGSILNKKQEGRDFLRGSLIYNMNNYYYTYNTNQPHTVQSVGGSNYLWDANGNVAQICRTSNTSQIYSVFDWDEENRLRHIDMPYTNKCVYYKYDAGGERFYKNVGTRTEMTQNGQTYIYREYDAPTLYASPYVVVTPTGYTKHYFVETERFASRIGDGNITSLNSHATNATQLSAKQQEVNGAIQGDISNGQFAGLRQLHAHWSTHHTTYWLHPDHLGSTNWVTDTLGRRYQHMLYKPWGETFVSQPTAEPANATRYTFSGKERDEETGYSYFGARHYNSSLSIWLSVDPMSDKYPGVSPYTYCANNPVRIHDPNGEDIWEINSRGRVVNHIENQTIDAFYMVDKKGNRIEGKEISFNYGTIESFKSQYSDNYNTTFDWYNVRGDDNGEKLFEFFANNTKVEFSHLMLGLKGDEGLNIISTSHETSKEHSMNFLIDNKYKYGYTIRGYNHNHPSNTQYPSGLENRDKDIGFAKKLTNISLKNGSGIPTFKIYIPKTRKYIKFNKDSTPSEFPAYPIVQLTGITCTPK
ncbi:MAG: JAB-like toxin 1 domain-containing protein [Bacteroidales bacterium]|nr:JAB-like toxin 1 domain-containing protein [Bacteroidales bacterium]